MARRDRLLLPAKPYDRPHEISVFSDRGIHCSDHCGAAWLLLSSIGVIPNDVVHSLTADLDRFARCVDDASHRQRLLEEQGKWLVAKTQQREALGRRCIGGPRRAVKVQRRRARLRPRKGLFRSDGTLERLRRLGIDCIYSIVGVPLGRSVVPVTE